MNAPLRAWIAEINPDALLADGFEGAFLGVAERCSQPALAVYDVGRCLHILQSRDGMTEEEAAEYFSFNTLGAWAGAHSPLYLTRPPKTMALRFLLGQEDPMPAKSERQRKMMGADLARRRAGKTTRTGMTESQLEDFAQKPVQPTAAPKRPRSRAPRQP
jgi:hypothetical protein